MADGKDVLCEKPLALTVADCKAMVEGTDMLTDKIENQSAEMHIPVRAVKHNIHDEINNFVHCILNDTEQETDGIEGGKTVAACCVIVLSTETGEEGYIEIRGSSIFTFFPLYDIIGLRKFRKPIIFEGGFYMKIGPIFIVPSAIFLFFLLLCIVLQIVFCARVKRTFIRILPMLALIAPCHFFRVSSSASNAPTIFSRHCPSPARTEREYARGEGPQMQFTSYRMLLFCPKAMRRFAIFFLEFFYKI